MGFFSDLGGAFGDLLTGGRGAAKDARRAATAAENQAFARFQELRDISNQDFRAAFERITGARNPFIESLTQLEPEFRQAGTSAAFGGIAPTAAAAGVAARTAGGGRGRAFSLASADLASRASQQAGVGLAGLLSQNRLASLQNIGQLRQFQAGLEEQALGRQFGLSAQHLGLQGALAQSKLTGTTAAGITGAQLTGNILATGLSTGLPGQLGRGIGNLVGGLGGGPPSGGAPA